MRRKCWRVGDGWPAKCLSRNCVYDYVSELLPSANLFSYVSRAYVSTMGVGKCRDMWLCGSCDSHVQPTLLPETVSASELLNQLHFTNCLLFICKTEKL